MGKRGMIFAPQNIKLLARANTLRSKRRKEIIRIYILAVFLGLLPFAATVFTAKFIEQPLYILLFPAAALSAWYGNMRTGAVTTIVAALGISYIYFLKLPLAQMYLFSLIELSLSVIGSLFLGFIIDKSKKTKEINIYKQREKKYAELLIQMQKEYEKVKKEIKARDEFLSIATHELKTPLTSMLLQLQKALHDIRSVSLANFSVQSLMRMIESVEGQSKRLSQMINDLLNVSLITTGRFNLSLEKFNLLDVVMDVKKRFSEELRKQHYAVRFTAKEGVIGKWDKIRIEQVIANLLNNAIKYGNGKPIEIAVHRSGSYARLSIKDHGIGISNEKQNKIFERFERAVSENEYKGLGVGLYITAQIVKAHGGKIKFESSQGHGSIFTVDLPVRK